MTNILINNVKALYPRIDRPYRFDNEQQRSVPCDPLEQGAAYDMKFEGVTKEQDTEIYKTALEVYDQFAKGKKGAPKKMANFPIAEDQETGIIVGKAKLAASFGGEATKKPTVFDSNNKEVPEDFQLTSGSLVNLFVGIVPYATGTVNGVTLRLKMVQVIQLAKPTGAISPFDINVDGFIYQGNESPFSDVTQRMSPEKASAMSFQSNSVAPDDDIPF